MDDAYPSASSRSSSLYMSPTALRRCLSVNVTTLYLRLKNDLNDTLSSRSWLRPLLLLFPVSTCLFLFLLALSSLFDDEHLMSYIQ